MADKIQFALYTIVVSPHQLPLARKMVECLGSDKYRYVAQMPLTEDRRGLGWESAEDSWIVNLRECPAEASQILETAEIVLSGVRDISLFEKRAASGLTTIYCSERWFKPWCGILRLLSPTFFKMAWCFVRLLRRMDNVLYYPIGIHAARDMARLCGLLAGDLRCLFRAPALAFEKIPVGRIWCKDGGCDLRYCLDKMRMWGYFVAPSKLRQAPFEVAVTGSPREIRVLWVGRLLGWKHVDTIIRAVKECKHQKKSDKSLPRVTVDIYGCGPMERRLRHLAKDAHDVVSINGPVPIQEVRQLMQNHDVYVLASDGREGWGAVVSEAIEEGMNVIGTYEAGSSATILADLFHAGDYKSLARMILEQCGRCYSQSWNAADAALALLKSLTHK